MARQDAISVVGVSGSLRAQSCNTATLRTACDLAPDGMTISIFDLAPIPLFNQDLEKDGLPAVVETMRQTMAAADGLLIVTPEYNSSIPGVLKNALDWGSRGASHPFCDKPTAIMGATPGMGGTARAQTHLRQILGRLNARMINNPEALIANAPERIGPDGLIGDTPTRAVIQHVLTALKDLIEQHR